jgi:hypothetical protein
MHPTLQGKRLHRAQTPESMGAIFVAAGNSCHPKTCEGLNEKIQKKSQKTFDILPSTQYISDIVLITILGQLSKCPSLSLFCRWQ